MRFPDANCTCQENGKELLWVSPITVISTVILSNLPSRKKPRSTKLLWLLQISGISTVISSNLPFQTPPRSAKLLWVSLVLAISTVISVISAISVISSDLTSRMHRLRNAEVQPRKQKNRPKKADLPVRTQKRGMPDAFPLMVYALVSC